MLCRAYALYSAGLLGSDGTTAEGFAAMVSARFPHTRVVLPEPGQAVQVKVVEEGVYVEEEGA